MSKDDTTMSIEPNLGGVLCYAPCCIGLIFSIVVAVVEQKSRFLRFHGFQSLLFHGAALGLSLAIQIFGWVVSFMAPIIGGMLVFALSGLCFIAMLGATIFLM